MDIIAKYLNGISDLVWGPAMLVLLLCTGIYLTILLRFLPVRKLWTAIGLLIKGREAGPGADGEVTPFQSLMTALSATIGTGNIVGVATAITLGGPGAVFWMWLTAIFGMATKYAEAVLAVHYREQQPDGRMVGGPMYYIKNGLGRNWSWLGVAFAIFAAIAGLGIGNMIQANSVAEISDASLNIAPWVTGLLLATMTFLVIVGGVKRIGRVAELLVPFMAIAYLLAGVSIIVTHYDAVPEALHLIVTSAFTGTAASGGFAGAATWAAIRFGVARGVFSNEAGLGSAAIAHAAAKTNNEVNQGLIAMLGTFLDTLIVCSITALVVILAQIPTVGGQETTIAAWTSGETGAKLAAMAFNAELPNIGQWVVTIGLIIFAFTTILGWSYYGERSAEFLFGAKVILPYRLLWVGCVFIGAVSELQVVWTISDIMNALMAIPNLIALLLLSGTIGAITFRINPATDSKSIDGK